MDKMLLRLWTIWRIATQKRQSIVRRNIHIFAYYTYFNMPHQYIMLRDAQFTVPHSINTKPTYMCVQKWLCHILGSPSNQASYMFAIGALPAYSACLPGFLADIGTTAIMCALHTWHMTRRYMYDVGVLILNIEPPDALPTTKRRWYTL